MHSLPSLIPQCDRSSPRVVFPESPAGSIASLCLKQTSFISCLSSVLNEFGFNKLGSKRLEREEIAYSIYLQTLGRSMQVNSHSRVNHIPYVTVIFPLDEWINGINIDFYGPGLLKKL